MPDDASPQRQDGMKKRRLGSAGIEIMPLALGGNVFDWTADEATSLSLIDRFVERGFSLIDTADVYSTWVDGHHGGESEAILGKWLRRGGARDKIVIATKVGMDMKSFGKGLSKAHILRSADASLKRLGVEQIDLYQAHIDDAAVPLEETFAAFALLVESGKIRAIGASNYAAPRLAEALAVSESQGFPRFACLQPHYHLANRSFFEGPLRTLSVAHYLDPRGLDILAELDKIAARLDATPAQIAIAWVMAQPGVTAPIVSATSLAQLEDVLNAAEISLDHAALDRLDRISA